MAKDPSTATIRGRLAADPELRSTGNGVSVVTLRLLSSGWEKDTAGNPVDVTPTSWRCEAWRDLADHIAQTFRKGDQVIASVRPKTSTYQRDDGSTAWSTVWLIDDIGPSLQRATASIQRTQRGNGPRPAPAAQQQPADPYAAQYAAQDPNDPWN